MPIRAFVGKNIDQLTAILNQLDSAMTSGSMQELRVSGIMGRSGPITQVELQLRYQQVRYELYLRAKDNGDADLLKQYPNPYKERVMRVETLERGLGGYTFPLVP